MDIDKLTVGEARQLAQMFGPSVVTVRDDSHWQIGKPYFIRTVTHHLTGKLVKVTALELVLEDAAWVPSDGRFAQAVAKGEFDEVEPFPDGRQVIVGRGGLIDAIEIPTVPRSQK